MKEQKNQNTKSQKEEKVEPKTIHPKSKIRKGTDKALAAQALIADPTKANSVIAEETGLAKKAKTVSSANLTVSLTRKQLVEEGLIKNVKPERPKKAEAKKEEKK